ncbi:MAG: hypothetical protein IPM16_05090 [Chloroflexi bacterium]|nr:hypothetical protein [Chloroflexota bacterium]
MTEFIQDHDTLPSELKGSVGSNAVAGRVGIMRELMTFLWQRKLYWMIPMIVVLLIFGLIIVAGGSSVLAPIIYPLF